MCMKTQIIKVLIIQTVSFCLFSKITFKTKLKNFQKFNLSSSHSSQLRNPVGVMIDYKFVKG